MLDPENEDDLITIAEYIKAIETNVDALTMAQWGFGRSLVQSSLPALFHDMLLNFF